MIHIIPGVQFSDVSLYAGGIETFALEVALVGDP